MRRNKLRIFFALVSLIAAIALVSIGCSEVKKYIDEETAIDEPTSETTVKEETEASESETKETTTEESTTEATTESTTEATTTEAATEATTEATTEETTEATTKKTKPSKESKETKAPKESTAAPSEDVIDENGEYTSKDDVALYIHTYGHLPSNFVTKKEAQAAGWPGGSLEGYFPGCSIGGDSFGNREGLLPSKKGRKYTECDIDTKGAKSRGAKRIVFSNDGLIYYTDDHYESFTLLYGEE